MATITLTFAVGASTTTEVITATDARVLEFLDDMRNIAYLEDPVLTRTQVGVKYMQGLRSGVIGFAKGLKQQRLDAAVAAADDLEGN